MKFRVDSPKAWDLKRVLIGTLLGMLATTLDAPAAHDRSESAMEAYTSRCSSQVQFRPSFMLLLRAVIGSFASVAEAVIETRRCRVRG